MKIVADRDIPFLQGVFEPFAEVSYLRGDEIAAEDVRDADAILTRTRTRCDAALLEGSRVKFIGTATIGFDHIDMNYCASRGIEVSTAAGCNARGVLQWVSAALAWLASGSGSAAGSAAASGSGAGAGSGSGFGSAARGGEFSPGGLSPEATTLGVVGVGNVGSLVKKYAESWGFRVMCSDPVRERAEGLGVAEGFHPLYEIVAAADVITFHVPLTASGAEATRHMVDGRFLTAARPNVVILNSSRGPIIEPTALREAISTANAGGGSQGRGRRFIIDTWNGEPDIDKDALRGTLLGTPHIAGYSVQGKATGTAMIVDALTRKFGLTLPGSSSAAFGGDGPEWFPPNGQRSVPREISWEEMCRTMPRHFDIAAESAALKAAPERFEAMRNNYNYRTEYF